MIGWEYERQRRNDVKKKAKDEAFRKGVDDLYVEEKKVCLTQSGIRISTAEALLTHLKDGI